MARLDTEGMTTQEAVAAILQSPFRWLGIWVANRSWAELWMGLPAIGTCFAFLALVMLGVDVPKADLINMYRSLSTASITQGKGAEGFRWLQRASQLAPQDDQTTFLLARSMLDQGDYPLGVGLIRRLAPRTGSGYPEAHFWLAIQILDSPEAAAGTKVKELQHHLTEATRDSRLRAEATAYLGDIAMRTGQRIEATRYYTDAVASNTYWSMKLIPALISLGRKDEAQEAAETAREFFRGVVLKDPENSEARIEWSRYAMALGDYAEAELALRSGQGIIPGIEIDQALSGLYVNRFKDLFATRGTTTAAADEADFRTGLEYLGEALRLDPNNTDALSRLPALAEASPELRRAIKADLERSLQQQEATAIVHFGIGVIESLDGDAESAKFHFELASAQGLQTAQLMNNLAWAIAHAETPRFDAALELANKGLALQPDRVEILDTRAHILAKMGRHQEAISDLERAIPQLAHPDTSRILLGRCYEAVAARAKTIGTPED